MFSTLGAVVGMAIAVILIFRKVPPAYALVGGAIAGGLAGGGSLVETVNAMIGGAKDMMPAVLRILSSGILAGALIKTGAAEKLAAAIVRLLGARFALPAIALATLVVTAVGVFIDIAVITVAPIALEVGRRTKLPVAALLVAMIGGGKAGNIISPNPNTIAVAEAFGLDLTAVIAQNIIPAVFGLVAASLVAIYVAKHFRTMATEAGEAEAAQALPPFWAAALGPLVVILLLAARPIWGVTIDPLMALPAGGIVCMVVCGHVKKMCAYAEFGLSKVAGVSVLLVGTGTIAGIIKGSALQGDMLAMMASLHLPTFVLAPVSGFLMSGVTASTTAGVTISAQTFAGVFHEAGVPAISAAAMMHASATIWDALPHGSFFHATAGAVGMRFNERIRLLPYGSITGLVTTFTAVIMYLLAHT